VEERERIEARLDARLEELKRTRMAMHRESDGMRGSEFAHVDNHPGDLAVRLQLASVLVRLGKRDEAAHHVREVIRRKPDHPIADPALKALIR